MPTKPKVTVTLVRREIVELAREHCKHLLKGHKELAATTEIEFWCADGHEQSLEAFSEGAPFDGIRVEFLMD